MTVAAPGLDPLIAEAKRRAHQRRLLAVVAAVALVLAAGAVAFGVEHWQLGLGSPSSTAPTHLTLRAEGGLVGRSHRLFHLSCSPPMGDVPQPAQACAAIAAQPTLITKPTPYHLSRGHLVDRRSSAA